MSRFRVDGKVTLITGAAGEIGSSIASLFAEQGALLALADTAGDRLQLLASNLGSSTLVLDADLSRVCECRRVIDETTTRFGRLDVLVNNVGVCPRISFLDSTEEDWQRIVDINQKSMFFCSQFAVPFLRPAKGRIISLASHAARAGAAANASIYSGTKGAIIAMTKAIARELAPDVLVNAVAPGAIDTAMVRGLPADRLASIVETIPLKRLGTRGEVAAAVLFLASAECGYIDRKSVV